MGQTISLGLPKSDYGQVGWATNLISLQLFNCGSC